MARLSASQLATPADVGWVVRPNPLEYELENGDDDIRFKFGRVVVPDDEDIIEWLQLGTSGTCGGEAIQGWYDGGWWVDVSCCVRWEGPYRAHGTKYYKAGDQGRYAMQIAEDNSRDLPSARLHEWRDLMDRTFALLRRARDGLVPGVELAPDTYRYLMGRTSAAARYLVPRGVARASDKRMRWAR